MATWVSIDHASSQTCTVDFVYATARETALRIACRGHFNLIRYHNSGFWLHGSQTILKVEIEKFNDWLLIYLWQTSRFPRRLDHSHVTIGLNESHRGNSSDRDDGHHSIDWESLSTDGHLMSVNLIALDFNCLSLPDEESCVSICRVVRILMIKVFVPIQSFRIPEFFNLSLTSENTVRKNYNLITEFVGIIAVS
jgi:hypothetical protein